MQQATRPPSRGVDRGARIGRLASVLSLVAAAGCSAATQPGTHTIAAGRNCAGNVTIQTRSDMAAVEGCNTIDGDLRIQNSSLLSLRGLENVQYVEGTLAIDGNASLRTLDGLGGLVFARHLKISGNPLLETTTGLRSLARACNVVLESNPRLHSLRGLERIGYLGKLVVAGNGVQDLHGLESLHAVGDLVITDNPLLERLHGLEGLASIRSVDIEHNPVLTGLEDLQQAQIASNVTVRDNTVLPDSEAAGLAARRNVAAR